MFCDNSDRVMLKSPVLMPVSICHILQAKVCADYDYMPANETELEIRRGDVITVLDTSDPNWWEGRLERESIVLSGYFPYNYVSTISD